MKKLSFEKKVRSLLIAAVVMAAGLIIFKFVPMSIFGRNILFDASMHLTVAMFVLYVFWYFIDQNKSWRVPYFIFGLAVITIISVQRVLVNAHNDIGLLAGFVLSVFAIIVSRWRYFHNKFEF
ncbi:MAG: phosphatase PAP2 family protein [Nanoarchaeota archaeon]|nr:phosphatase PAP2 family protein [Nanoarchaeota archaeon]MBU0977389.1 phosphatase PAP2 family protein [Nanoarchaeota archaeon]